MNNTIKDLFLYFAKFPTKSTVLELFKRSESNVNGYADVLAVIEAAEEHSFIEEITEFAFGTDESVLSEKLKNAKNTILFVEVGRAEGNENEAKYVSHDLNIAVTIAVPENKRGKDDIEKLLVQEHMFALLKVVLSKMIADRKECKLLKGFEYPSEIFPTANDNDLFGLRGWTAFITIKA